MKTALIKMLKMEDLKIPVKDAKKMKTAACVGSPIFMFIELLALSSHSLIAFELLGNKKVRKFTCFSICL